MMLNKLQQWPAKILIIIIMMQVIALSHLGNLQTNFAAASKTNTVNIFTPCPKAELSSKVSQQLCQNHFNTTLNSALTIVLLPVFASKFIALTNHNARYKMLTYSIFKPPKN